MIKSLLATIAVTLGCTVPALAENTLEDHRHLWRAIQSVGVETKLNDRLLCDGQTSGVYLSSTSQLIICQDFAKFRDVEVEWTANDLDTLRHEAHHLIQDCADQARGDNNLITLFDDEDYHLVVNGSLAKEDQERIVTDYQKLGADPHLITLELEAFAVARVISARSIANKVIQVCKPL